MTARCKVAARLPGHYEVVELVIARRRDRPFAQERIPGVGCMGLPTATTSAAVPRGRLTSAGYLASRAQLRAAFTCSSARASVAGGLADS